MVVLSRIAPIMFPISDDLSSELRLIVVYGGHFLMLRGFERIPQAEEQLILVLLLVLIVVLLVHDGVVLHSFGRQERRQ